MYSPTGRSTTDSPTFTWTAIPGAITYHFYLGQFATATHIYLTPAQVDPTNSGVCTFTPTASMTSGVYNAPFPVPLSRGHCAAWWVETDTPGGLVTPGELMFYVPTAITSTTDFNVSYIDTFDPVAVTKWYYVSDFIGQGRRVIDFSVGSGTNNLGFQTFHENAWIPVDISDLVPLEARVAIISMEVIYSATSPVIYPADLLGWSVRRHGSTLSNTPNAVLRYTTASRTPIEFTAPLNQGKFDFYWSHIANGIDVAATNGSTVTGRAMNASLVGYGMP